MSALIVRVPGRGKLMKGKIKPTQEKETKKTIRL